MGLNGRSLQEGQNMNYNWYVIYTKPDTEIILRDCICQYDEENDLGFEVYLPMTTEAKQWSDRVKTRQTVLFKQYIFVKHDDNGFHAIKKMPGFGYYLQFGQFPCIVPSEQIEMIRAAQRCDRFVTCQPKRLIRGARVRILKGALADYEGILIDDPDSNKVAIEVSKLNQCVQIRIDQENLILL
jgi:transcriptional antiterminator RfaH